MEIVKYPHPTLRHKSKPLQKVDAELRQVIAKMFELMYEAKGVGLAANQVDLPYRLFVVNLGGERGEDEELVFIKTVISSPKSPEESDEGCLSLPGLYAPVRRPGSVVVSAFNLSGEQIQWELNGLLSRVVQHETDHLDGVLFIDRISETAGMSVRDEIDEFKRQFEQARKSGGMPSDQEIDERLAELEKVYC
ncbi:MAG: peptide deformylase [Planctomycetales bacterium]